MTFRAANYLDPRFLPLPHCAVRQEIRMWISCRIRTDSHSLNESAFRLLTLPASSIRVSEVSEDEFLLSLRTVEILPTAEELQILQGHHAIRAFLVAINVATLGMYYMAVEPWVHPILFVADDIDNPKARNVALVVNNTQRYERIKALDEFEVQNAVLIFGVLARERTLHLEGEYIRGLLLLRMNFLDVNFRREAFLCFYRALENFISTRILRVQKLKNEVRDIKRALVQIGAPQTLIDEVDGLYGIRSSQVTHAQIAPKEIALDDVLKIKAFIDFVMHTTFKVEGIRLVEAQRNS